MIEDGKPIQRGDIQGLIQLAAVADGQARTRYGSHSLRVGGATAEEIWEVELGCVPWLPVVIPRTPT